MRIGLLKGVIVILLFGLLFLSSTAFAQPVGNHYAKVVISHPKTHSYGLKKAEFFNMSFPIAPILTSSAP